MGVGSNDYRKQFPLTHGISAIRLHRLAHGGTFLHDVALVKLSEPLEFQDGRLGAVCLPEGLELEDQGKQLVTEWDLSHTESATESSSSFLYAAESSRRFWFDCARNHMNFGAWDGHNGPEYPIECSSRPQGAHRCFGNFGSVLLRRSKDTTGKPRFVVVGLAQKARHNCLQQESKDQSENIPVTYAQIERLSVWMYHAIWDMVGEGALEGVARF